MTKTLVNEAKKVRTVAVGRGQTVEVPIEGTTGVSAPDDGGTLQIDFGAQKATVTHLADSPPPLDPAMLALIDELPNNGQDFEILEDGNGGYEVKSIMLPVVNEVAA